MYVVYVHVYVRGHWPVHVCGSQKWSPVSSVTLHFILVLVLTSLVLGHKPVHCQLFTGCWRCKLRSLHSLTLKDSTYSTISSGLRQDLAHPPQQVSLGKCAGFLCHSLGLHISLNLHSFVKTSETQTIFQSEFIYLSQGLAVQPRAGLELSILMHQTPDFCDFRCTPQRSAFKNLLIRDYYIYL